MSIQEIRIGLWYPDRYQHGGGRSHTDQGKGSHTSVPAAKLPFSPDNGAQHKTDRQPHGGGGSSNLSTV